MMMASKLVYGIDDVVGTRMILNGFGVDDSLQFAGLQLDSNVLAHDAGVAVIVDGSFCGTVDVQFPCLVETHMGIALNGAGEEVHEKSGPADALDGLDDDDVEQAVLHRSARGDVGIVAILCGIGTGNEKCPLVDTIALMVLNLNIVGLALVTQAFLEYRLGIG